MPNSRPRALGAVLAVGLAAAPAVLPAQLIGGTLTAACGALMRQPGGQGDTGDSLSAVVRFGELRGLTPLPGRAGSVARVEQTIRLRRERGWLGLHTSEISETRTSADGRVVRYCDYPVIVSVDASSPSERAGLAAGDTIVAYNGIDLRRAGELPLDRLLVPDSTLKMSVRRDGRSLVVSVVVGRRPEAAGMQAWSNVAPNVSYVFLTPGGGRTPTVTGPAGAPPPAVAPVARTIQPSDERMRLTTRRALEAAMAPTPPIPPVPPLFSFGFGGPSALAGAQIVAMNDDLRAVVGARASGVLVLKVVEDTPAGEAGLRAGDVIVSANGRAVESPGALQQAFLREAEGRSLSLRVERKGKGRDVVLRW